MFITSESTTVVTDGTLQAAFTGTMDTSATSAQRLAEYLTEQLVDRFEETV